VNRTDRWWHVLSQDDALWARQLYREGMTVSQLAAHFKVATSTISGIIRGRARPVLGLPNISRGRGRPPKV
jgi:transposase